MNDHARPICVLNAGSSSLKMSLFRGETLLCRALIERIGVGGSAAEATIKDDHGALLVEELLPGCDHEGVLDWVINWCQSFLRGEPLAAVGHRVVHGGDRFTAPTLITDEVITQLEVYIPLAPLHEPHNIGPIRYLARRMPTLPQIACFDTAFHATQSELVRRLPLPRRYHERGIKRYGFHGLSYEYIAGRLADLDASAASGRTIVCHLGNGASLCAMREGASVATTMSFTALDGLMMGTRSGALDPGVLLYLLQQDNLTPDQLSDMLYKHSGLLGVSGLSSDMRDLLSSQAPEAVLAVDLFCYRIVREIGSLVAALQGLDALVFTGGIGENAAAIRQKVCAQLGWLGVRLATQPHSTQPTKWSDTTSTVLVLVVPTDEERMIARHTARLIAHSAQRPG